MARVRITAWRDIPVVVTARDESGEVSVALSPAFQDLIDRVAMREGLADTDAYLEGWGRGPEETEPGSAAEAAARRAGALEASLPALEARYFPGSGGGGLGLR